MRCAALRQCFRVFSAVPALPGLRTQFLACDVSVFVIELCTNSNLTMIMRRRGYIPDTSGVCGAPRYVSVFVIELCTDSNLTMIMHDNAA